MRRRRFCQKTCIGLFQRSSSPLETSTNNSDLSAFCQLNACEVYCNSVGPKNDDEKMQLLSINHPLRAQSSYLLRLGGVFFSLAIHVSDQKLNQLLYLRGDIILLFL